MRFVFVFVYYVLQNIVAHVLSCYLIFVLSAKTLSEAFQISHALTPCLSVSPFPGSRSDIKSLDHHVAKMFKPNFRVGLRELDWTDQSMTFRGSRTSIPPRRNIIIIFIILAFSQFVIVNLQEYIIVLTTDISILIYSIFLLHLSSRRNDDCGNIQNNWEHSNTGEVLSSIIIS